MLGIFLFELNFFHVADISRTFLQDACKVEGKVGAEPLNARNRRHFLGRYEHPGQILLPFQMMQKKALFTVPKRVHRLTFLGHLSQLP